MIEAAAIGGSGARVVMVRISIRVSWKVKDAFIGREREIERGRRERAASRARRVYFWNIGGICTEETVAVEGVSWALDASVDI